MSSTLDENQRRAERGLEDSPASSLNLPGGLGESAANSAHSSTGEIGAACTQPALGDVGRGADRTAHFDSIDLAKPGDLALVNRAVVNGWDVPQHVRDALCEQFVPALRTYTAAMRNGATPSARHRAIKHVIKMAMLGVKMDAANMIAEGFPREYFPYLRKRRPEKRKPRRRPATQAEALERLLEKLERRADGTE